MRRLFPPAALDANYATRLAEDMLMLWRRMESAVSQAETELDTQRRRAQEATRRKGFPWPFGRR
jgi:DNA invertase Pin-like site-specific DNA recombinase